MAKANKEFFNALHLLEKEKGIPVDFMIKKISESIIIACKRNYGGNDDALINIDPDKAKFEVFLRKSVVEDVINPNKEISLDNARNIDPKTGIGEKVNIKLNTKQFGRIAAQTARNIIRQGIRDGEREQLMQEFKKNYHEIINAQVDRIDDKNGAVTLKIGKSTAVLPKGKQISGETFTEGQFVKVYVSDITESDKGPRAVITRVHPDFVKHLFEKEVPEIYNGEIEIKAISREPGSRTKMAVLSHDENIDCIGSCIGSKGMRIANVSKEINSEKIDVVKYSDNPVEFISAALSPAKITKVIIDDEENHLCRAIVSPSQLSLAIGNKGQNVRLAAKLTGWKIDIKPEEAEETSTFDSTALPDTNSVPDIQPELSDDFNADSNLTLTETQTDSSENAENINEI
ncbi:MAG: transcription termination factor NusA [Clostridia bacterium]|nr:transcription termination factor NusA [Clostridia bacterium]